MNYSKTVLLSIIFSLFLVFSVLAGQINLNTATQKELQSLPYIGPKIAALIIEYREKHGPFKSIDELLEIKGIGQKKLERIKPYVSVE